MVGSASPLPHVTGPSSGKANPMEKNPSLGTKMGGIFGPRRRESLRAIFCPPFLPRSPTLPRLGPEIAPLSPIPPENLGATRGRMGDTRATVEVMEMTAKPLAMNALEYPSIPHDLRARATGNHPMRRASTMRTALGAAPHQ